MFSMNVLYLGLLTFCHWIIHVRSLFSSYNVNCRLRLQQQQDFSKSLLTMLHHDSSYHMTTHDPEVEVSENGAHENKRRCKSGTIAFDDEIDDEEYSPDSAGLVFSSLDTHFSPLVALEQFIFHVFFPFTVPIAWCRYGMKHTHLQMYGWKQKLAWPSTYIPFVCIASSLVCLVAEPDVLKIEQLVLPFGVFILQRLMIAVKYASLSPDEYRYTLRFYFLIPCSVTPEDIS